MKRTWWVDINELDEDQKRVIALPGDGDYLLLGPAGSGKTNLLLLRGKYLYKRGEKNILVVVFTRTLQEFIVGGSREYEFPTDRIVTHRRWQQDLLYSYGIRKIPPDTFEAQRAFFTEQITNLVDGRGLSGIYDAILIDEAQDYTVEEIKLFKRLGKKIFAVADSRQQIYAGENPVPALEKLIPKVERLRFHYRNGRRICELADALAKDTAAYEPLIKTCRYNEEGQESSVEHAHCVDLAEQIERVLKRLPAQLAAYPDEFIGVLTPRREEMDAIWQELSSSALGQRCVVQGAGETISFAPDKPICICTAHAAKGLEFRATHLLGCEYFKKFAQNRNLVFTAVTRTKTALSLYYSAEPPGYLASALSSIEGPAPEFELSDLFPKAT
ncbi:MAG TPA: ATP-binding domain-containing protein [Bryobacteraceae bacterium]|jgi:superfamily I DNA and RNA helicase|nr:ATP-binding domain-containing protein [Bryobacteraceae bacterium]